MDLRRFEPSLRGDLLAVLRRGSADSAACFCTASYGAESAEAFRDRLFAESRSDGCLLYEDGDPVAWCQFGACSAHGPRAGRNR
jgi:hypothetical protein